MNNFLFYTVCLIVIFGKLISESTEGDPKNALAIFYYKEDSFIKDIFRNFSRIRYGKGTHTNLNINYLLLTKNLKDNLETFCYFLANVKVVAILSFLRFNVTLPFYIAARHLKIPLLHFQRLPEDFQVSLCKIFHHHASNFVSLIKHSEVKLYVLPSLSICVIVNFIPQVWEFKRKL